MRRLLQAAALRRLGVTSLGVFGSYARNEQTPTSDVDLLVTFVHLTFRAYMDAKLLLEAALGLPVDLVLADDLRPRLRERVLNEVIYVYVVGLSICSCARSTKTDMAR